VRTEKRTEKKERKKKETTQKEKKNLNSARNILQVVSFKPTLSSEAAV
jgi:hypothetical protein